MLLGASWSRRKVKVFPVCSVSVMSENEIRREERMSCGGPWMESVL